MDRPSALTIHELRDAIEQGRCDPRQALTDLLERIGELNPRLHAYIALDPDRLTASLEDRLRQGPKGRLFGIPITVKDNICIQGEETACGSRMLTGFRPPYHAAVIERLLAEGAIVIPRANMDEFAFGSSTETSAFGLTRNPWDLERVPGGSSGGSATAVAADLAIGALGTDTGGSIRQPAAFCGVVGLKPTYGRVSRYGLIAFASSLDQIGPVAKDVKDCAWLLSVIAGADARDSTSAPVEVPDYLAALGGPVKGLRFGVPKEYFVEGIDPQVRQAIEQAAKTLQGLGMQRVEVGLPHTPYAVATYYVIATAEASSNLARYDGVQYGYRSSTNGQGSLIEMYLRTRAEGFGPEAKRRIMLGTYVLSRGYYDAYYLKALKVRTLIKRDFDQAFERCDVILTPTSPTAAFRLGEKIDNPLQMYLSDIFTISVNLAGIPALSLPCGFTPPPAASAEGGAAPTGAGPSGTRAGGGVTTAKLPIGMQLLAGPFEEARLFQVASAYEQATDWHRSKPVISDE